MLHSESLHSNGERLEATISKEDVSDCSGKRGGHTLQRFSVKCPLSWVLKDIRESVIQRSTAKQQWLKKDHRGTWLLSSKMYLSNFPIDIIQKACRGLSPRGPSNSESTEIAGLIHPNSGHRWASSVPSLGSTSACPVWELLSWDLKAGQLGP